MLLHDIHTPPTRPLPPRPTPNLVPGGCQLYDFHKGLRALSRRYVEPGLSRRPAFQPVDCPHGVIGFGLQGECSLSVCRHSPPAAFPCPFQHAFRLSFFAQVSTIVLIPRGFTLRGKDANRALACNIAPLMELVKPLVDENGNLPSEGDAPPYTFPTGAVTKPSDNVELWFLRTPYGLLKSAKCWRVQSVMMMAVWTTVWRFYHVALESEVRLDEGRSDERRLERGQRELVLCLSSLSIASLTISLPRRFAPRPAHRRGTIWTAYS